MRGWEDSQALQPFPFACPSLWSPAAGPGARVSSSVKGKPAPSPPPPRVRSWSICSCTWREETQLAFFDKNVQRLVAVVGSRVVTLSGCIRDQT